MSASSIIAKFGSRIKPTYGRFPICLSHGSGSYVYDVEDKKYLDLAGGIAVNSVGHAHPYLAKRISEQAGT